MSPHCVARSTSCAGLQPDQYVKQSDNCIQREVSVRRGAVAIGVSPDHPDVFDDGRGEVVLVDGALVDVVVLALDGRRPGGAVNEASTRPSAAEDTKARVPITRFWACGRTAPTLSLVTVTLTLPVTPRPSGDTTSKR